MSLIGQSTNLRGHLAYKGERGYSAYEIAVQNGYVGTEQDWLATLGTTSHFSEDSIIHTSTADQTVFALPTCYTSNSFIDVYVNGLRLNSSEYTVNVENCDITLTKALSAGAEVEIIVLTMSTNNLPIVTKINKDSTDTTVPSSKTVYDYLDVYYDEITSEKFFDNTSNTTYYITKIPHLDKNGNLIQLKLGIANDNEALNTLESTLEFAHRKGATLCINAGLADTSDNAMGTIIKDGVILKDRLYNQDHFDFLGIKEDNTLLRFNSTTTTGQYMLNVGVKNALMGFYAIIENGAAITKIDSYATAKHPRQVICELTNGDMMIFTCEGRTEDDIGMTVADVVRILTASYSVKFAYVLDGGGSTSTVLRGSKVNKNIDENTIDRPVATFLYIAKDNVNKTLYNCYNEVGKLKQESNANLENFKSIIGNFNDIPKVLTTCDIQTYKTGLYLASSSTENAPSTPGYNYILHLKLTNNEYIKQISIPATDDTMYFRRYSNGSWSNWTPYNVSRGSTANRPKNPVQGTMYFDTTLNKPIWYGGASWLDSTGTAV